MDRVRMVFSVKTGPVLTDPELTKTGPRIQITSRRFGTGARKSALLCAGVAVTGARGRMRRKPEEEEQDFF